MTSSPRALARVFQSDVQKLSSHRSSSEAHCVSAGLLAGGLDSGVNATRVACCPNPQSLVQFPAHHGQQGSVVYSLDGMPVWSFCIHRVGPKARQAAQRLSQCVRVRNSHPGRGLGCEGCVPTCSSSRAECPTVKSTVLAVGSDEHLRK